MVRLEHKFAARLSWGGSTGGGYRAYPRTHSAVAAPAAQGLTLSSDQAFHGDPQLLNPEQLVVMAASSCQLLSFLAVAARAGINVVGYTDEAEGVMPQTPGAMALTRIELRPRIVLAAGTDPTGVEALVKQAHEECFIANSLRTDVVVTPTIELAQSR
jgi:organic hydroperoxide reductase OsmC/OhrA